MSDHVISTADMEAIARSDDRQRLQDLLDRGMDLERTDEFMITPLGIAAKEGALACVRLLVEFGAGLDAGDPGPVNAAIKAGNLDVLKVLLSAGAESGGAEDYDPEYPAPLVVAAEEGNVPAVEVLIAADSLARSPWAAIDDAYWHGLELRGKKKLAILRALTLGVHESGMGVPSDASILLRALKPLARAAKKERDPILDSAVREIKGRLDLAKAEQDEAENAFLESRFDELFELIERVPASRRSGILGVVAASSIPGYYFSSWLLEKGAAANLCDENGQTSLMHVAAHGYELFADPLLHTGHACLNARDDAGKSALELLEERPRFPSAHLIESALTHPLNVRRDRGTTPLRISKVPEVAQRAWELMRDRQIPEVLDLLNKGGLDQEDWRLAAGAAVLADSANDCMTVVEYCLDRGADTNARNDLGANVLHAACGVYQTSAELLCRLVKAGADPTLVNGLGRSVADQTRRTWPEDHECRIYMENVIAEAAAKSG